MPIDCCNFNCRWFINCTSQFSATIPALVFKYALLNSYGNLWIRANQTEAVKIFYFIGCWFTHVNILINIPIFVDTLNITSHLLVRHTQTVNFNLTLTSSSFFYFLRKILIIINFTSVENNLVKSCVSTMTSVSTPVIMF